MNELTLYGTVGASWWDEEYFTAKQVRETLAGMSGDLLVRINSGGGIATEGQAIYTALKDYRSKGRVTVQIDGVAASAASLIAMAGEEIVMRLGAWMLIHDPATPWTMGRGTEDDHRKEADLLAVISNAYADIYADRSGLGRDEARRIMKDETVIDGTMAVDLGFADRVETEAVAEPAAKFDYRMYAHAPQELREASKTLGRAPGEEAVMAMIAGRVRPSTHEKEPSMGQKAQKPAGATAAVEDTDIDQVEIDTEETPVLPEVEEPKATAKAVAVANARAKRITDAVAMAGLPIAFASDLIGGTASLEACLDQINAKWKEQGDMDTPMHGRAKAQMLRDERDTMNEGIGIALQARLGVPGVKVDGTPGREFMDMGLSEIAALSMGKRAPRDAQGKLEVFMAGTHSTSDFNGIFENALNKRLQRAYDLALPTYREISQRLDFADYRPHPVSGVGELTPMTEVLEGAEVKSGTFNDKRESLQLRVYGTMAEITEQMIVNDDLNAIARMLSSTGQVVAANEDAVFYSVLLQAAGAGPTLGETGRAMFNATDVTLAGTGAAITVDTLTTARAALMTKRSLNGLDLNMVPAVLLVGPARLTQAQQVVSPLQADAVANQNPFAGLLRIVVTPKITGNAWYLFADPRSGANFAYGFLQGSEGPQVRNETPIGRLGVIYQVTHRFGCGAIDFRAGFRNPGA